MSRGGRAGRRLGGGRMASRRALRRVDRALRAGVARCAAEVGLDPAAVAQTSYDTGYVMPWEHISTGVSTRFLAHERKKAAAETTTPTARSSAAPLAARARRSIATRCLLAFAHAECACRRGWRDRGGCDACSRLRWLLRCRPRLLRRPRSATRPRPRLLLRGRSCRRALICCGFSCRR